MTLKLNNIPPQSIIFLPFHILNQAGNKAGQEKIKLFLKWFKAILYSYAPYQILLPKPGNSVWIIRYEGQGSSFHDNPGLVTFK